MKIVDPHLHLFDLQQGEYGWLREGNPPHWPDKAQICSDFNESDLATTLPNVIAGFVHIEAGFDNTRPWREVDWLTDTVSLPFRSVAGISLLDNSFNSTLSELVKRPCVVGVRDILDDDAIEILTQPRCKERLAKLADCGLSFDAQLSMSDPFVSDLFIDTLCDVSNLLVVLNHGGWPPNDPAMYEIWLSNMAKLAELDNVAVKLSGWEMQDRQWHIDSAVNVVSDVVNLFDEDKVMLASNFPLSNWRLSYDEYWRTWQSTLASNCSSVSIGKLLNSNAARWYKLEIA